MPENVNDILAPQDIQKHCTLDEFFSDGGN